MIIEIPDIAFSKPNLTPETIRIELAVYLYERERISFGQARNFSGLDEMAFRKELKKRGVHYQFDIEGLEKDLQNLALIQ